jgi:hypothetical protein
MSSPIHHSANSISDWFWHIIDDAGGHSRRLKTTLRSMPDDHLYRFALEFMFAADMLHQDRFIDQMQYASEDNVLDMSHWVVSQGRDFFNAVWNDPQLVGSYPGSAKGSLTNLHAIAELVLEERHGAWPEDIIDLWDHFYDSPYPTVTDYWADRQNSDSTAQAPAPRP